MGKDKNYEKKINEKSVNKKKIEKKTNRKGVNKKKIGKKTNRKSVNKKKIGKKSVNKKKIEKKVIGRALLRKLDHALGVYPNRQNVSSAKSISREAAAFATQDQKRGIEYGTT